MQAATLQKVAKFAVTPEMRNTYAVLIAEFHAGWGNPKFDKQKKELIEFAKQEQLNILQLLIYRDAKLIKTIDANHAISRYSGGFLSPRYAVVYCAAPKTDGSKLQTAFDQPKGLWDYATGTKKSLPNPVDRMKYVNEIAKKYNDLMATQRGYMEGELQKIRGWLNV